MVAMLLGLAAAAVPRRPATQCRYAVAQRTTGRSKRLEPCARCESAARVMCSEFGLIFGWNVNSRSFWFSDTMPWADRSPELFLWWYLERAGPHNHVTFERMRPG